MSSALHTSHSQATHRETSSSARVESERERSTVCPPQAQEPLSRAQRGALGEQLSARYLEGEGYRIEARNWRGQTGELDIIATQGVTLVIIEVRARAEGWLDRPSEAVTLSKQRQVARCADEYLRQRARAAPAYDVVRFDVIGVTLNSDDPSQATLEHEEGAFCSPWAY